MTSIDAYCAYIDSAIPISASIEFSRVAVKTWAEAVAEGQSGAGFNAMLRQDSVQQKAAPGASLQQ
jgi:hypothetical protein